LTSELLIRVARIVRNTTAEGPGNRYAIWVQGCTIRCDGCFNPHLWTAIGGTPTHPESLISDAAQAGIEGITLLGGEPFDQAAGLAPLAELAQEVGLSVMTFTGRMYEALRTTAEADVHALLDATDLLVDGPYLADQPDLNRPWVGSTNQQFHFLTERYRHLQDRLTELPDRIEARIAANGEISLNGWATVDQLDRLLAQAAASPKRGKVR